VFYKLHCVLVSLVFFVVIGSVSACFMLGDFTGDCQVDFRDLLVLAESWFSPEIPCTEPGLVGHWKFEETIEATASDSSGFGRHGELIGEPSWNPFGGKIGGARIQGNHRQGAADLHGMDPHVGNRWGDCHLG